MSAMEPRIPPKKDMLWSVRSVVSLSAKSG